MKIDRSFISSALSSANDRSIIKAIVALAHGLGLTVIAEGVETREQLEWLGEENCAEVQGFLMSLPQSAEDMKGLIQAAGNATIG
ncbi:EAL domain-containing protein [Pseudomonas reactans]|uniref:EAL domain-containing protein n=1 Tax=Pseudomonas reactans TaxID=117680 RepID=A0A7Y8G895_9PSED|nr:EAL domain-containing protein [Pseudomonas reactans]NWD83108.1 EAL domain-containing protein [Pseudomonas reactans]NWE92369.1 EAL domain-containing protein [Pseudomonas reactans]